MPVTTTAFHGPRTGRDLGRGMQRIRRGLFRRAAGVTLPQSSRCSARHPLVPFPLRATPQGRQRPHGPARGLSPLCRSAPGSRSTTARFRGRDDGPKTQPVLERLPRAACGLPDRGGNGSVRPTTASAEQGLGHGPGCQRATASGTAAAVTAPGQLAAQPEESARRTHTALQPPEPPLRARRSCHWCS